MTNAIDAAMAKAQAAAVAPSTIGVPAQYSNGGVPATAPARGTALTLDDFSQGAMGVEEWLKVKEFGLLVGSKPDLIDTILVDLDASGIQVCEAIKFNNPATYLKSYDGVSCVQGGSWEAAVARAKAADHKANTYKSADLCMTLAADIAGKKGEVLAEAGTKLGHSLSTTNRDNFAALLRDLTAAGFMANGVVHTSARIEVGFQKRTNKNNNTWGVLTFKLIGSTADESAGPDGE